MSRSTGLFQHAYLVNDLSESCRQWSELLGAGSFVLVPHHRAERFSYRGTDTEADVSYAFGYLGDQMIQFIQQHDQTPSIYREMYEPGEEGFHHIGMLVDDFEAELGRFVSQGFEVACRLYADRVDAAYIDTRPVTGGFTEIHGNPPHILKAFDRWRLAHQARRPGDDPITGI